MLLGGAALQHPAGFALCGLLGVLLIAMMACAFAINAATPYLHALLHERSARGPQARRGPRARERQAAGAQRRATWSRTRWASCFAASCAFLLLTLWGVEHERSVARHISPRHGLAFIPRDRSQARTVNPAVQHGVVRPALHQHRERLHASVAKLACSSGVRARLFLEGQRARVQGQSHTPLSHAPSLAPTRELKAAPCPAEAKLACSLGRGAGAWALGLGSQNVPWDPRGAAPHRIGEAKNPGPQPAVCQRHLASINVTSLFPAIPLLGTVASDIIAIQEHSVPAHQLKAAKGALLTAGYASTLTPPDPESGGDSGGVGILVKKSMGFQALTPRTAEFTKVWELGRACMAVVSCNRHLPILIVSVYGWADGDSRQAKYSRTSDLMSSVFAELQAWHSLPTFIMGDLNAPLEELACVKAALAAGSWHDLGGVASAWGGQDKQPTARAHNSLKANRIDYVLSNSISVPMVREWLFQGFGIFDVHGAIRLTVDVTEPIPQRQHLRPQPISVDHVEPHVLRAKIDSSFAKFHTKLKRAKAAKDTGALMQSWTEAFEEGLIKAAGLSPAMARKSRGRGPPRFEAAMPKWASEVQMRPPSPLEAEVGVASGALLVYKRACMHLAHLAAKWKGGPDQAWSAEMLNAWAALQRRHAKCTCIDFPLPDLKQDASGWARVTAAMKLHAIHIERIAATTRGREARAKRKALGESLAESKGAALAYKLLANPPPRRLVVVQSPQGLTADPSTVDSTVREAWGQIYQGNLGHTDKWQHAFAFVAQYSHAFKKVVQPAVALAPITAGDILKDFARLPRTSAGPDSWGVAELRHITPLAASHLADLYQLIEEGADWPPQLQWARVLFLGKGEGDEANPLAFRLLTVCSLLYRRWAAIRLAHLQGWIETWADSTMFGGFKGRSTDEAIASLALDLELAKSRKEGGSAMSIDIMKCFDQMSRELVWTCGIILGAPAPIMSAWYRVMSSLRMYNVLAASVGEVYTRPMSIPQGCPLSMVFLAMVVRPMIELVKSAGGRPRSLADDLTVAAFGHGHWGTVKRSCIQAHGYLVAAGSRIAQSKSFCFSTDRGVRQAMRAYQWPHIGKVAVVMTARDLGAQLSFGAILFPGITHVRIAKAIAVLKVIGSIPSGTGTALKMVNTKALPLALFGCEASPIGVDSGSRLLTAVKSALGIGCQQTANAAMLCASLGSRNPDPRLHILLRRAKLFRKLWHDPEYHHVMLAIVAMYYDRGHAGILLADDVPNVFESGLTPIPPAAYPACPETRACGPVSLLLTSLARIGVAVSLDLELYFERHAVVSLTLDPWHSVRHALELQFRDHALRTEAKGRASYEGNPLHVDWRATFRSINLQPGPRANLLRAVIAGGLWSSHLKGKAQMAADGACEFCGHAKGDIEHKFWSCPHFHKLRDEVTPLLAGMDPTQLPALTRIHGLCPCVPADLSAFSPSPSFQGDFGLARQVMGGPVPEHACTHHMVCAAIRGRTPVGYEFDLVPYEAGPIPPRPNTFTDGSLAGPKGLPELRKGGCGIYLAEGIREHASEGTPFWEFTRGGPLEKGGAGRPSPAPPYPQPGRKPQHLSSPCLSQDPCTFA